MRLCWRAFAVTLILVEPLPIAAAFPGKQQPSPNSEPYLKSAQTSHGLDETYPFERPVVLVAAEAKQEEPDIDMYALMSGRCSKLKVAGRDFTCKVVAYFHSQRGRADFTIVLDDPNDQSHIISFSGENARREQENLYELSVDRMLLKSKDRPKIDGLPVPLVELSSGMCRQIGNFATREVSSIACVAVSTNGQKYELQFESDGAPIRVLKLRQTPLPTEQRRARQIEHFKCRVKADVAKVLPRDRAAYLIRCLEDDGPKLTTDGPQ